MSKHALILAISVLANNNDHKDSIEFCMGFSQAQYEEACESYTDQNLKYILANIPESSRFLFTRKGIVLTGIYVACRDVLARREGKKIKNRGGNLSFQISNNDPAHNDPFNILEIY